LTTPREESQQKLVGRQEVLRNGQARQVEAGAAHKSWCLIRRPRPGRPCVESLAIRDVGTWTNLEEPYRHRPDGNASSRRASGKG